MSDLISKQAVLELWERYQHNIATEAIEFDRELRDLLSDAQVEVPTPRGRLIDADSLIGSIKECAEAAHDNHEWDMEQGYLNAIECVEEEPTIEAEPHKKEEWEQILA